MQHICSDVTPYQKYKDYLLIENVHIFSLQISNRPIFFASETTYSYPLELHSVSPLPWHQSAALPSTQLSTRCSSSKPSIPAALPSTLSSVRRSAINRLLCHQPQPAFGPGGVATMSPRTCLVALALALMALECAPAAVSNGEMCSFVVIKTDPWLNKHFGRSTSLVRNKIRVLECFPPHTEKRSR